MSQIKLHKKLSGPKGEMLLDVDFTLSKGKITALYGPSGAGKTSIAKMIGGFMKPDQGLITIDNTIWYDSQHNIFKKPQDRTVGFVFQDYALFPNMSIRQNLIYALPNKTSLPWVSKILDVMELSKIEGERPEKLSGGQKQRVALARALVQQPSLLVLDEPLSSLDAQLKSKIQTYLKNYSEERKLTTLLISHDRDEIESLSDYIYTIKEGKIVHQGKPEINTNTLNNKLQLQGKVVRIEKNENHQKVVLDIAGQTITIEVNLDIQISLNETFYLNRDVC
ncbi:ATP-binding cassette domain-containing protein [Aquimarina brevivitae]|uniref:Molybdate transport system ATP-binding protein n=1 Tax=Aquimarina brevivitae TaxID=323412 RepID=A0A4Q7P1F3_9FLAO|nr:ATP-binding cassette domain-containing protein [Aquimarina brevivitae]RZS93673.1 molybdate transport system ATP-binding protein [Aquimarina brevivitae]